MTWCGSPTKDHLLESTGSGVAFLDLTGDGLDDILVLDAWHLEDRTPGADRRKVLSRGTFAFYVGRGDGTFEERTEEAGLSGGGAWGCGVAAGDIDDDGDLDLYVYCFGPNLLYRNLGNGRFEEIGAASGVADPGWGGGAALFDADGDGDLDLYLANYIDATFEQVLTAERTLLYHDTIHVMVGPFGLPGGADRYFENRGDGTFEEGTSRAGLTDVGLGYGLGVLAADFDQDSDLDLYVANDSNPNYLFRNDGQGRFEEIGVISGAAFSGDGAAQAGMGVETGDFDGDGVLDLFVTHFSQDASTLYGGEGGLFFSDISARTGVAALTFDPLSWGTAAIDFDQDGRTDLLVANGHIYPQVRELESMSFRQQNLLLLNRDGSFVNGSAAAGPGFQQPGSYRGLAWGDLEGDGDPDLIFTRIDETPVLLRHDGGDPDRWLVVAPDPGPTPRWIGARIELTTRGDALVRTQTRVILSGASYASQSSMKAVFGLAQGDRIERVVVRFPGGETREFTEVSGGQVLEVPVPR